MIYVHTLVVDPQTDTIIHTTFTGDCRRLSLRLGRITALLVVHFFARSMHGFLFIVKVFKKDTRSEQQQIDDLLCEISDEVAIDSHDVIRGKGT